MAAEQQLIVEGLAEQSAAYLARVETAVVESGDAVRVQMAQALLMGEAARTEEGFQATADRMAGIMISVAHMFKTYVETVPVDVPEALESLMSGAVDLELGVGNPAPLAELGGVGTEGTEVDPADPSGDAGGKSEDDGTEPANSDPDGDRTVVNVNFANSKIELNNDTSSETAEQKRSRQESLLASVFGSQFEDEISGLEDTGIAYIGNVLAAIYQNITLHPRAEATREARVDQFARYFDGTPLDVIAEAHEIQPGSVRVVLSKAVEILQREHPKEQLDAIMKACLEQLAQNS